MERYGSALITGWRVRYVTSLLRKLNSSMNFTKRWNQALTKLVTLE
jgi:hypothetical protein